MKHIAGQSSRDDAVSFRADVASQLESSPNGIVVFEADVLLFVTANPAAYLDLGYSESDCQGMTLFDLYPETGSGSLPELIRQIRGGRHKVGVEMNLTHRDKSTRWALVQLEPGIYENKPVIVATSMPAPTPQTSTPQIGARDQQISCVFEYAAVGMAITDLEGLLWDINSAACKIVGYPEANMMTTSLQDLIHPDDIDAHNKLMTSVLSGEILNSQARHRYRHASGQYVWIQTNHLLTRDELGQPIQIVVLMQDISERISTETKLAESEERYRLLVENAPICIHEIDDQGRLSAMNRAGLKMMNVESESAICGRSFLDFIATEDYERTKGLLERAFAGEPSFFEYRVKTGSDFFTYDSCFIPIIDTTGTVRKLMGVTQDFTERRAAEEQRLLLERQVQVAQKLESLGVLAGGIAHDFNNLLVCILGYSDLARRNLPANSPSIAHLDEVVKGAQRATTLTRQLLAYSGKGTFVVEPLDMTAVINEMRPLLNISISKKSQLVFELAPDLPPIETDASQLHQVIMNLVINASDAIGDQPGLITIGTGTELRTKDDPLLSFSGDELPEGRYAYLEIADDGYGMSAETRASIFEPFFTTKSTGYGLGMAAVLGIVHAHHGTLRLESEPGVGTTFRLLFPVCEHRVVSKPVPVIVDQKWRGDGFVLVVDDEPTVRRLAQVMLERMGFSVLTAEDGREAVDIYRERAGDIDLVLLDMYMPVLDGGEAYGLMKEIRGDVKAILSSGFNRESTVASFGDTSPAAFIQKPYSYEDLVDIVRRVTSA